MKALLLVFIMAAMITTANAQYTVTKVIGAVKNQSSGQAVRPGTKLNDDDVLAFSSRQDMLRVIVSGKGVYIISPSPQSKDEQSLVVEMLKSALHIKSKEGYLSGRAGNEELIPTAFETEARVNSKNLILEKTKYLFDPSVYPVSKGDRFFLQIENPGAKVQIKPLKTNQDTLLINASDFTSADIQPGVKYRLGFFSREKSSSSLLAEIRPYLDTTQQMTDLMTIVMAESKELSPANLEKLCYAEVYEALGKPSDIQFREAFDKLKMQTSNKQ